jgi:hypothetical protein
MKLISPDQRSLTTSSTRNMKKITARPIITKLFKTNDREKAKSTEIKGMSHMYRATKIRVTSDF